MSDLPEDLIEEILCRVPATSINRLRYTCKGWNSLFNKRRFIRKHMDKAAKKCLVLMLKQSRICLMSVNFYGIPSVEVKAEYSLLDPHQASLDEFKIFQVSHYDGLLLCNNVAHNRIVVWNPCTGQTKWIQPRKIGNYALGCYQHNKYGDKSYKILCCCRGNEFEIFEINSSSWRTLDVTLDCQLEDFSWMSVKALKGKTYWCAFDLKEKQLGMFLVSFDYTTERFERLLLPCHCPYYHRILSLSVVREEKLSVLLKLEDTPRIDIWVTNKIDESTKVVSWSKVLTVDLKPDELCIWKNVVNFLVDEEKKFLLCTHVELGDPMKERVYIVGGDNRAKQELSECTSSLPLLFHYVPSLTQIQL